MACGDAPDSRQGVVVAVRLDPDVRREYPRIAPRLVLLVLSTVFTGYFVNAFMHVQAAKAEPAVLVSAVAGLAALAFLQFRFLSNPHADVRGRTGLLALLANAALTFGGLALYG